MLKLNDANNVRRTAAGLCLIGGPLAALIGGLLAPWEGTAETEARLQMLVENPARGQASAVFLYLGYLLIAVGIFGMMHLLRHRAVILGHVAGALAILGWVTLPGLLPTDFYDLSLAQSPGPERGAAISECAQGFVGAAVIGIPVPLGVLGLALLLVALWRAGRAPAWVPVIYFLGTAVSFFGPPTLIAFTTGTAAWLATLGYVGLKVLGMSDEEWEHGMSQTPGPPVVAEAPQQVR
jgi:hypothetical protein